MVAVLPGEPQTSSVIVLALNSSRTSTDEPPPKLPRCTPKTPCSRCTTNPESATTTATTKTSQVRLNRLFLAGRGAPFLSAVPPEDWVANGSVLGSVVVMGASILNQGRRALN